MAGKLICDFVVIKYSLMLYVNFLYGLLLVVGLIHEIEVNAIEVLTSGLYVLGSHMYVRT